MQSCRRHCIRALRLVSFTKPAKMSTARHFEEQYLVEENILSKALQGISFSCSGSLQINHDWKAKQWAFDSWVDPPSAPPVIIRWDADGSIGKIRIPLQGDESPDLDRLIKNGLPATFGHDGNDVLDESYRKAIKLDCDQFSSNFHPHDHGILDIISQTLLPTVAGFKLADQGPKSADKTYLSEDWGLVAELYKLNIYSAPSGRFKTHVDTPRGPRQWGSLVVCLPVSHQGMSEKVLLVSLIFCRPVGIARYCLNAALPKVLYMEIFFPLALVLGKVEIKLALKSYEQVANSASHTAARKSCTTGERPIHLALNGPPSIVTVNMKCSK